MDRKPLILIFIMAIISFSGIYASAGVWDIEPEIPSYDPLWKQIDRYYKSSLEEEGYDRIIEIAYRLKRKYPDKHEPLLWMAWAYQRKGYYGDKGDRKKNLKTAAAFSYQSYKIKKNLQAQLIFAASAPGFKDIDEIKEKYGAWIKDSFPLPNGRELPEMPRYAEWNTAIKYWDERADINAAHKAVNLFKAMAAKNPRDCSAQMWACRGIYYLARWYELENKKEKSVLFYQEGAGYGKKALAIDPDGVPANFWFFLTFASSIVDRPFYEKVMYTKDIAGNIILCCKKNSIYFYGGPIMVAASATSKESELTRGILELFGFYMDDILLSLDLAEICYPSYLSIPVNRAEFFYDTGQKEKARKILIEILRRNPEENKLHVAENYLALKHAKNILSKIK